MEEQSEVIMNREEKITKKKTRKRGIKDLKWLKALEILTPREVEILKYVAMGYTSKEIAKTLFISTRTVQKHREKIVEKLGISGNGGLRNWCRENIPGEILRSFYVK